MPLPLTATATTTTTKTTTATTTTPATPATTATTSVTMATTRLSLHCCFEHHATNNFATASLAEDCYGPDGDGDDGTAGTVTDNDESAGHSLLAYLRMHRCLFQDNITHKGMGPSYSGQMAKCMCMKK